VLTASVPIGAVVPVPIDLERGVQITLATQSDRRTLRRVQHSDTSDDDRRITTVIVGDDAPTIQEATGVIGIGFGCMRGREPVRSFVVVSQTRVFPPTPGGAAQLTRSTSPNRLAVVDALSGSFVIRSVDQAYVFRGCRRLGGGSFCEFFGFRRAGMPAVLARDEGRDRPAVKAGVDRVV
jgi:hypothetical protein